MMNGDSLSAPNMITQIPIPGRLPCLLFEAFELFLKGTKDVIQPFKVGLRRA